MTDPTSPDPPADGPPRRFGGRDAFIAAVLLVNIALPLSYYIGRSDSPLARYDERFAWRMFSPVRIARCQVDLYDGETPIQLTRELHVVWINLLKRARPSVVNRVLDKFCDERGPDADIRLSMVCTPPEASTKTICDGPADRDRDGVPDAYATSHYCGDQSPAECFAAECADKSARACYAELCRATVYDRSRNQCSDREAI